MTNPDRSTESDIALAVLKVLASKSFGEASFRTLIDEIPKHIDLTAADRAPSTTRTTEELWEQQVRNITSHHNSPGNFIYLGYIERVTDGLKITETGQTHLKALSV